jgi:GAG-pre-integrase domain
VRVFLENGLYFLDSNKFGLNITKDGDLGKLCHKRVGHPSEKNLKTMFNFANLDCNNCEVCKLAKHTKLSFCDSKTNSSEPLELVHSDVWGPAPISSYNDYRYFMIFIDVYSRATWLYLMKNKSEVFFTLSNLFKFSRNSI